MLGSDQDDGELADPMTLFLTAHRRALPGRRDGKRFNAGEHAWLAGHGAERACRELDRSGALRVDPRMFSSIRRRAGREELDYGELVALSGDFYETPQALFDETPARLPWLYEANDLSDLRQVFAEELQWIESRRRGLGGSAYPEESIRLAWNAKSYVELALRNTDHFGWHNVLAYCRHHAAALNLAVDAQGRDNETFRRALYTSAFADHFLTDGFAAGHVRVPRAEIREWAGQLDLGEKVAGALSKLLHDQDGHVDLESLHGLHEQDRAAEDGLLVENARGAVFRTRCDGQLFLETAAHRSPAIEQAVGAVSASVQELLLAWKKRELPEGIFRATEFVPFPHADAPRLIDKFPSGLPESQIDRLWENVAWFAKVPWLAGLQRRHVVALLAALPPIMDRFRANVGAMADQQRELVARISPKYVAAYRQIA